MAVDGVLMKRPCLAILCLVGLMVCAPGAPGLAEEPVRHRLGDFEQVGVAAAHHQGQGGELDWFLLLTGLHDHGVDVALDVVDSDER